MAESATTTIENNYVCLRPRIVVAYKHAFYRSVDGQFCTFETPKAALWERKERREGGEGEKAGMEEEQINRQSRKGILPFNKKHEHRSF